MSGVPLENLREAQTGLAGVAVHTPLIPLDFGHVYPDIRLKAEYQQPIGAFKIRGAWTALRRLPPEVRARGVVTSSSGNHGQGIAYAAQRMGIRAVIVMPESTPQIKLDGVLRSGGEVVLLGKLRGPEQTAEAERLAAVEGLTMIPPYDHPDVIAGQGTCGLEILEDWPEVTTILVPVGGGGLLAGITSAVLALRPDVRLVAVEPAGIPKVSAALAAGGPTTLTGGASLADGLLTKSVGTLTWPIIQQGLSEVVGVTDDELVTAVRWLGQNGIRVEPSGAATTAALLSGKFRPVGPTALIGTGGNVDPLRYAEWTA